MVTMQQAGPYLNIR